MRVFIIHHESETFLPANFIIGFVVGFIRPRIR